MFERLTDAARQVIDNAKDQARKLYEEYVGIGKFALGVVGSENLVLGIIIAEEEGLAPRMLTALGVDKQKFHEVLLKGASKRNPELEGEVQAPQLPFTPRAKKIIELSLREALSLGHNYIGVEHLLLASMRESEGVGVKVLEELGVDSFAVYRRTIESLSPNDFSAADPAERLKHHIRQAKAQVNLIKERLPQGYTMESMEVERIERDLECAEERLKRLKKPEQ